MRRTRKTAAAATTTTLVKSSLVKQAWGEGRAHFGAAHLGGREAFGVGLEPLFGVVGSGVGGVLRVAVASEQRQGVEPAVGKPKGWLEGGQVRHYCGLHLAKAVGWRAAGSGEAAEGRCEMRHDKKKRRTQ
jgi:hypothetical protein